LTYGEPSKEELLVCASVITAYQHMIALNNATRSKVISKLRLGPNGPLTPKIEAPFTGHCGASRDGECGKSWCPQIRDDEPNKSGRHCPLDTQDED
jgi:hypothetical protein